MTAIDWTWIKVPRETATRLRIVRGPNEHSYHAQIESLLDLEANLKEDLEF